MFYSRLYTYRDNATYRQKSVLDRYKSQRIISIPVIKPHLLRHYSQCNTRAYLESFLSEQKNLVCETVYIPFIRTISSTSSCIRRLDRCTRYEQQMFYRSCNKATTQYLLFLHHRGIQYRVLCVYRKKKKLLQITFGWIHVFHYHHILMNIRYSTVDKIFTRFQIIQIQCGL